MKREPTEIELNSQKRIKQLIDSRCDGSQQVFADRVGIGKSSVSQYVNGTNFPTNIRAKQIADIFGVSPMWIMGFDVPMLEETKKDDADLKIPDKETAAKLFEAYRQIGFLSKYEKVLKQPVVQDLVSATVGCSDGQIEVAIKLLDAFKTPGAIPSLYDNERPHKR